MRSTKRKHFEHERLLHHIIYVHFFHHKTVSLPFLSYGMTTAESGRVKGVKDGGGEGLRVESDQRFCR